MLSIQQIKAQYSSDIQKFERGILREYLQYLILSIIFSHSCAHKLAFLGGTALRIVYGLNRFSEDIDFDNKGLTLDEFEQLAKFIKTKLEKEGFIVEIKVIEKMAFHCHIKFPELLYKQGITNLPDEKILITVDTFDQGVAYTPEWHIIDKFEVFKRILVTPKSVILSQKLWTITQRKRAKGRDFYDLMTLFSQTKPDVDFLNAKFGTSDWESIKRIITEHTTDIDLAKVAEDVAPFLIRSEDSERILLFNDYLKQVEF